MLIRNQLRNQLDDIKLNDDTAYYYICALSTFAIKEAIPFIISTIIQLEGIRQEIIFNEIPENSRQSYQSLLKASCDSFLHLGDLNPKDVMEFVQLFEDELQLRQFNKKHKFDVASMVLINYWGSSKISGLETILQNLQIWPEDRRIEVYHLIIDTLRKIDKVSNNEKIEAKILTEEILRITPSVSNDSFLPT